MKTALNRINGTIESQGWIQEFLQRDKKGITGNLDRLCEDVTGDLFGRNRTDNRTDGYWSSWWPGESEGNWAEAYIRLAFALGDKVMEKRAGQMVCHYLDHQDADGYIGIYLENHRFSNGKRSGELWTQSRLLNTLLVYYHHTKDAVVLKAMERLADCIVRQYGPAAANRSFYQIPDEDGSKGHGLMIIEPLLALYQILNKQGYLTFCEFLYADYSMYPADFPGNDIREGNLTDPKIGFVGHGPHTCEQMRIVIELYEATGKEMYLNLFHAAMVKLKQNLQLSGSCKSDEQIGVYLPEAAPEEPLEKRFGPSTILPSQGYEYCATTEMMFSLIRGLLVTGDLTYADMEEWMIYNAAMAARQPDGKAIQYLCADNLYEASRAIGNRWDYSPTHTDAAVCCAPNSGKIMPVHLEHMWLMDEAGLTAVFYGPSSVSMQMGQIAVRVDEETEYPFENQVRLKMYLSASARFSLSLRIPGWARSAKAEVKVVNGESFSKTIEKAEICSQHRLCIDRVWEDGDEVRLSFDAGVRIMAANDGTLALACGPLLYALNIETRAEHSHNYELAGFYDTNYYPVKKGEWDYTLKISKEDPEKYVKNCRRDSGGYVWDEPPVYLNVYAMDRVGIPKWHPFLPIGCTTLRRTTFPAVCETGERS